LGNGAGNEKVLREGDRGAELFQLKNLRKNIFPPSAPQFSLEHFLSFIGKKGFEKLGVA